VPVAVLVEDRELRAGVRTLTPDDQPGALRPGGQVHVVGQLRNPRAVALGAAGVDRLLPRGFLELEDRLADCVVDRVADREPDPSSERVSRWQDWWLGRASAADGIGRGKLRRRRFDTRAERNAPSGRYT
jgi:hypothetical protein